MHRVIPILPAPGPHPALSAMVVDQPELQGPPETVARVLQGLREVVDPEAGASIVELHWIRSLKVEPDEVDLTLSFQPRTAHGRELAEMAFDRLRRLLPDTDVFVHHA
jgi:metal-sulfur cluster biosynthetic enzyme